MEQNFYDLSAESGYIYDKISDGIRVKVYPEDDPISPREDQCNYWCFSFCHRKYNLGDEAYQLDPNNYSNWSEYAVALVREFGATSVTPIYMQEHGGITLTTTCPNDLYDSGQIGFAFVKPSSRGGIQFFFVHYPTFSRKRTRYLPTLSQW